MRPTKKLSDSNLSLRSRRRPHLFQFHHRQQNHRRHRDNDGCTHSVKVLDATFFDRSAEDVAHDLIECRLHWRDGDQSHSRITTETEAYVGPEEDLASHAARG